jgi:hypothetical protein
MSDARVRLGKGATVPRGGNVVAQMNFLRAVERQVPNAMRELGAIASMPPRGGRHLSAGGVDRGTEDELKRWADRCGFPYPGGWWMRQVRNHVKEWRRDPKLAGSWIGFLGVYREPKWPAPRPWNANEETEQDFRDYIEGYIRQVKKLPGVQPTPVTFRERDFDALALEHVAGLTIDEVADRLHVGESSTIRKRNAQLAKMLGLNLRRRSRGRRPTKTGKTKFS